MQIHNSLLLLTAAVFAAASLTPHEILTRTSNLNPINPIDQGRYADPDIVKIGDTFWVYATISIAFDDQTYFDAFSSQDLQIWKKHPAVFTANSSIWAKSWFWAPSVVERAGRYYLYYTCNNPIANQDTAGVGVGVSDSPSGPFVDLIDRPIVGRRYNGANAMDQQVFVDDDGSWYLVWGGSFVNIAPLGDDMASLGEWPASSPQDSVVVDITPSEGYVEGAFMLKRRGVYYLMWSEGGYGEPDYRVAYAMSSSIVGPFERIGLVLQKDGVVADGPGHHSVIEDEGVYWMAYHRRIIGDAVADHRQIAVDRMEFDSDGRIKPVVMT